MRITKQDRYRGALLGLAVGDAVGTTLEFKPPGTFEPIGDMVGGGPFGLAPGQWTDDTSMALCLAESLVACRGFDPADQMRRYVRWWNEGYLSSTGTCFDIGNTTATALRKFTQTGDPYSGPTEWNTAGNGSIMRLAAVPLFLAGTPDDAIARAADSSRTTHGATTAVDACRYLAGLIVGAVQGVDKATLLSSRYCPVRGYWEAHPLHPQIDEIAAGSFKDREPPEIKGLGHVVRSLEAALWAFDRTDSYKAGCLRAVNLGDDADTTGAVYGQLAGGYYGATGIPAPWREQVALQERIETLADSLYTLEAGSDELPV